MLNCNYFRK